MLNIIKKGVLIMSQNYTLEFKRKIVHFHLEKERTYKSVTTEYSASKASYFRMAQRIQQRIPGRPLQAKEEYDSMKEKLGLKRENEKTVEGNRILKNAGILCKRNQLDNPGIPGT